MFAYQWERGVAVIEICIAPTTGIMASAAIGSETTAVFIIVCVTGITTCRCSLVSIRVTGVTRQVFVLPCQREAGICVIEGRTTPIVRGVAGATIRAELTVMGIFVRMAGVASAGRALINAVCVAGIAGGIAVLSGQRETCVAVVEGCPTPTVRGMAGTTIRTELTVMGIFVRMAGVAGTGRAFVNAIYMAGFAGDIVMLSGQWESCIAVVEGYPAPTIGGVAGPTIPTELPVMGIISYMTGITILRRTLENTIFVA